METLVFLSVHNASLQPLSPGTVQSKDTSVRGLISPRTQNSLQTRLEARCHYSQVVVPWRHLLGSTINKASCANADNTQSKHGFTLNDCMGGSYRYVVACSHLGNSTGRRNATMAAPRRTLVVQQSMKRGFIEICFFFKGRLEINPGCSRTKQLSQDLAEEARTDGIRG